MTILLLFFVSIGAVVIKLAQAMKRKWLYRAVILKTRTESPLEPVYLHNIQRELKYGHVSIFLCHSYRFITLAKVILKVFFNGCKKSWEILRRIYLWPTHNAFHRRFQHLENLLEHKHFCLDEAGEKQAALFYWLEPFASYSALVWVLFWCRYTC